MKETVKKIDIYQLLPYAALLICTVLLGGSDWYSSIIPLLLFFVYLTKNRKSIPQNINTLLPVVLLLAGFAAIIPTQGDKQNALYEYEQMLCFIAAFFVGLCIKDEAEIFKYILACAAVTAVFGLLSYCGIITIEGFTFNDRYVLRLQSFLKYANTAAVLLGCGYFAALRLRDTYNKKSLTYLSACILLAFYLTVSKAAIPLFIIFGTALLLVRRESLRCFVLQNVICMIFTVLIIAAGFRQLQAVKLLLILSCIAAGGKAVHNDKLGQIFTGKRLIALWLSGLGIFLISGCLLLASRGISIFQTLFVRLDYMRDALSLLKEHPLTGIGPGAWKYYQYSVQTTQYNVTDIHNGWLQIWLEFGFIFFAAMLAALAKAAVYFVRKKMYAYGVMILFIITHSLVDIDLSFGIILMLLGLMAGFALRDGKSVRAGKPLVCTAALLCFVLLGYMTCECAVRSMFEHSYLQNKNGQAARYAAVLEKICPYDSSLQISLAALTGENERQRISRAAELSPLDPGILQTDIEYSISQKDKSALEKIKRLVKMAKRREATYVKAKEYSAQALEAGLCTREEYDRHFSYIENQRRQYGIVDRNSLLEDIANNR